MTKGSMETQQGDEGKKALHTLVVDALKSKRPENKRLDGLEKRIKKFGAGGKDRLGRNAVHIAVSESFHASFEMLFQALLQERENPNAVDNLGRTPLHWAVSKGHEETVTALISAGAALNTPNTTYGTPLELAKKEKKTGIARIIEDAISLGEKAEQSGTHEAELKEVCDTTNSTERPDVALESHSLPTPGRESEGRSWAKAVKEGSKPSAQEGRVKFTSLKSTPQSAQSTQR